ncbi:MAG: tetratricopeptide repeat protein [Candidatus Omnitrophota bacterium]
MKKTLLLCLILLLYIAVLSECRADKIYYIDGRIVDEQIAGRNKDVIKIQRSSGTVSVKRDRIDRILSDDGSISKYDYEGICNAIRDKVKEGNYAEAASLSDLLLQSFSKSAEVHYLSAVLNHKAGNISKTKEDYNFVLESGTVDAKILNNLGAIYATDRDNDKAIEMFNQAIEKDPGLTEAHFNLAGLLLEKKDYPAAINEYNKVIEREPDNTEALYNLGVAYFNRKDLSSARNNWKRILSVDPDNREAKAALNALSSGN